MRINKFGFPLGKGGEHFFSKKLYSATIFIIFSKSYNNHPFRTATFAAARLMTNPASRRLRRPSRQSGLTETHENRSFYGAAKPQTTRFHTSQRRHVPRAGSLAFYAENATLALPAILRICSTLFHILMFLKEVYYGRIQTRLYK